MKNFKYFDRVNKMYQVRGLTFFPQKSYSNFMYLSFEFEPILIYPTPHQ